jgi:hypothetical protein
MMPCPACGGWMQREPASVTCVFCGRYAVVLDASDDARMAQRVRDTVLRPRSAECNPEWNVPRPLGWVAGQLRLPGQPHKPRSSPQAPAKHSVGA